MKKFQTAIETL